MLAMRKTLTIFHIYKKKEEVEDPKWILTLN